LEHQYFVLGAFDAQINILR